MELELRIDNLIQYKDEKYRRISMLDGESNGVIALKRIGLCDIKDCKPIPLTEEWLLKFGVDINDSIKNLPVWLGMNQLEGNVYASIDSYGTHETIIPCKYVHQLQNLYFALTNTELKIIA